MLAKKKNSRRLAAGASAIVLASGWLGGVQEASAGPIKASASWTGSSVRVEPGFGAALFINTGPNRCEVLPRQYWHEPVYETRRTLVEIPARIVTREVPQYNPYGRVVGYKLVEEVVEPARQVWREERVLVKAGFYETVYERVCVPTPPVRVARRAITVNPVTHVHQGYRGLSPRVFEARRDERHGGWEARRDGDRGHGGAQVRVRVRR